MGVVLMVVCYAAIENQYSLSSTTISSNILLNYFLKLLRKSSYSVRSCMRPSKFFHHIIYISEEKSEINVAG